MHTWLKACPRCGGDLVEQGDVYGPYVACLQCGHILTAREEVLLRAGHGGARPTAGPRRAEAQT